MIYSRNTNFPLISIVFLLFETIETQKLFSLGSCKELELETLQDYSLPQLSTSVKKLAGTYFMNIKVNARGSLDLTE